MFHNMTPLHNATANVDFAGVTGGNGPPLLLLHGYPQTHVTWRHIAPELARRFTVVAPDLPGYGASAAREDGQRWTKRRVAAELVALMRDLGHDRFAVVGHDRGARAGYRLALDHAPQVTGYASLTVIPTVDVWQGVNRAFAMEAFHWFLLAQPADLPERLLASDPDGFIDAALSRMAGGLDRFEPQVLAAYRAAFRKPEVRRAMCEDYRAAEEEDAEHDAADRAAGRRLGCPVLVLWPQTGDDGGPSPLEVWRRWAADVTGAAIPGNHLLPEFSPREVLAHLVPFLDRAAA